MEHDKYKSCERCPHRCADPNCHETCEGYKTRQAKAEKVRAAIRETTEYISVTCDAVERTRTKKSSRTLLRRRNEKS